MLKGILLLDNRIMYITTLSLIYRVRSIIYATGIYVINYLNILTLTILLFLLNNNTQCYPQHYKLL